MIMDQMSPYENIHSKNAKNVIHTIPKNVIHVIPKMVGWQGKVRGLAKMAPLRSLFGNSSLLYDQSGEFIRSIKMFCNTPSIGYGLQIIIIHVLFCLLCFFTGIFTHLCT